MSTASLYDRMFQDPAYNPRDASRIKIVKDWIDYYDIKSVLDVGCGRGHYLKAQEIEAHGIEPSSYLCKNDLNGLSVTNTDILGFKTKSYDGLYSMDVLEHIPPSKLDENLQKLTQLAPKALYGIANHSDIFLGEELHLIQEDSEWWMKKLKEYYKDVKLVYEPPRYMVFECSL